MVVCCDRLSPETQGGKIVAAAYTRHQVAGYKDIVAIRFQYLFDYGACGFDALPSGAT
jgi:hypothetical protein